MPANIDSIFLSRQKHSLAVSVYSKRAPVAQLVEHWAVMREVVSLTQAGPSLRVLK